MTLTPSVEADREPLPLSLLNDYLFCSRRAALKTIDGLRGENEHTVLGDIVHENADLPGYEQANGITLLRGLLIFSRRLGLTGRCDIVEHDADGTMRPVEYKKSARRRFANDDAQLCAQALCLEEMLGRPVPAGAVYHAASRRRREVAFTPALRAFTEESVAALHAIVVAGRVPVAVLKPVCSGCSLYSACLPEITSHPASLGKAAAALFRP